MTSPKGHSASPQGHQSFTSRSLPRGCFPTFRPLPPAVIRPSGSAVPRLGTVTTHTTTHSPDTTHNRTGPVEQKFSGDIPSSPPPAVAPPHLAPAGRGRGLAAGAGPRGRAAPRRLEAGGADAGACVWAAACGSVCVLCVWLLGPPWPPKWGFPLPVARETNRSATTLGKGLEERVPEPHEPARSRKGSNGVPLHPQLGGAQQTRVGPAAGAAGRPGCPAPRSPPGQAFRRPNRDNWSPYMFVRFLWGWGTLFKNRASYKLHTCTLL